eukprot:scaffold1424_cov111-Isochrysis_galbana.AAC.7
MAGAHLTSPSLTDSGDPTSAAELGGEEKKGGEAREEAPEGAPIWRPAHAAADLASARRIAEEGVSILGGFAILAEDEVADGTESAEGAEDGGGSSAVL